MEIGKWKIIKQCENRSKDGHLLFDVMCKKCGHIRLGVKLSNLNKTAFTEKCIHPVPNSWASRRLSHTYRAMLARCYDKKRRDYKFYGGKGICVCEEWKNDPKSFMKWAEMSGYKNNLTIDRIDSNKNYSPENCRWIDSKSNSKYKSSTRILIVDGVKDSLTGHAKKFNIPKTTLFANVRNKTDEEAVQYIKNNSRIVQ